VNSTSYWLTMRDDEGRKSDGEGTFAGTRGNDEYAPIPAVRGATIEPLEPTLMRHSRPRQRSVGRPGSGHSRQTYPTYGNSMTGCAPGKKEGGMKPAWLAISQFPAQGALDQIELDLRSGG
jgi:hypothetical protein